MKAVIPAAGLGTRFLPATKTIPKEMLPLLGKPVIQHVVEEAVAAGIHDIIIVTSRGKTAIEDHFDRSLELESWLNTRGDEAALAAVRQVADLADIHYVRQREPLGLGDAVLCAHHHIGDEPFALLLGDDVTTGGNPTKELMAAHGRTGMAAIAVENRPHEDLHRYGVVDADAEGVVRALVEKPTPGTEPSDLAIMGRYVLPGTTFDAIRATGRGVGGEVQLTDALTKIVGDPGIVAIQTAGQRLDLGQFDSWLAGNIHMAWQDPKMRAALEPVLRRLLEE